MSTITKEFTKEQLQQIEAAAKEVLWPVVWSEKKAREHFCEKITPEVVMALSRIALAMLEAEPVAWQWEYRDKNHVTNDPARAKFVAQDGDVAVQPLFTAPPVPVSVPDAMANDIDSDDHPLLWSYNNGWNACRAAMLQGAENAESTNTMQTAPALDSSPKIAESTSGINQGKSEPVTTAYKLPDDFDFDRFNDVVWLEAVASNPHMHSPTTSTIAMVALELNRKLAAGNSLVIPEGWVACSDRMPDLMVTVITSNGCDIGHAWWDGEHWKSFDWRDVVPGDVTHWQPMPKPPLK